MKAIVFSKPTCTWCERAVDYMTQKDIDVEKVNIITEDGYNQLLDACGSQAKNLRTVPQITIDGKYIGGYQDAVNYIENNG
jgi:glutaredoxin